MKLLPIVVLAGLELVNCIPAIEARSLKVKTKKTSPSSPAPVTSPPSPAPVKVKGKKGPTPYPAPALCCNLSPEKRAEELLALYSTVSDPTAIAAPGTPQFKALNWILTQDTYCICPDTTPACELVQRYVMAVYYYSTGGEGWTNCGANSKVCDPAAIMFPFILFCYEGAAARWLSDAPSCQWCGNNCDDTLNSDCITQINLDGIGQSGILPFELQNITHLYYLSNEDGTISSTIPEELGSLKNLSWFDLNFQDIQGPIPKSFYKVDSLRYLDLNDNKMTGSISSDICNLPDLFFLQLGNDQDGTNDFSGTTIPNCIGRLSKLRKCCFVLDQIHPR